MYYPPFRIPVYISLLLLFFITISVAASPVPKEIKKDTIIIKPGVANGMITSEWKNALGSRMSKEYIDSLAHLQRALTKEEQAWKKTDSIQDKNLEYIQRFIGCSIRRCANQ